MSTTVVKMDYNAPQQRYTSVLDTGVDVSAQYALPADAIPGAVGSISTMDYGSAPFNASVTLAYNDSDFSGTYQSVEQTLYFQIAGGSHPRQDCKQYKPGSTVYVNVTLAHAGKEGKGPKNIAFEPRHPQ